MKELTGKNFREIIDNSENLVLVDFWTPWCGPCKSLMPILEELSKDFEGSVLFAKVDADNHADLAHECGIKAVPTIHLYRDGELVGQHVGVATKKRVLEIIETCRNNLS